MNTNKIWIFLLFLLFTSRFGLLFSQNVAESGGFRHITVRDGLPSSEVYKIIQDRKGYLWMCTDAGVSRYNGFTFQSFTTRNGLTDNTIFRLKEDNQGRIWAQGFSGALSYFDGVKFNGIPANDSLVALYSNGQKSSFCMELDSLGGVTLGGIYIKGLFRVGPEDNYSVPHRINIPEIPRNYEMVWKKESKSHRVIASIDKVGKNGYFMLSGRSVTIALNPLLGIPSNNQSIELRDHHILFSFYNQLFSISPEGNIKEMNYPASIVDLNQDHSGNIWVSLFLGGTYLYSSGDLTAIPKIYLPGKTISHVFDDNETGYWFSTVGDGVYYLPDLRFGYLTKTEGLQSSNIQSLTGFNNQSVVIGLPNGTTSIFNPDNYGPGRLISCYVENRSSIPTEAISSVHDSILISNDGIRLVDSSLKTISYITRSGHFKGVAKNSVTGNFMFYSASNFLWLNSGFVIDSSQVTKIRFTTVCYARDGTIWMGALNGLWKMSGNEAIYLGNSSWGIKARIDGICEDKNGILWIATRGEGLFAIQGKQKWHFGEEDGMSGNTCRSITMDESGTIWVGTNHGVTAIKNFNTVTGKATIRYFNTTHGLLSDEVKFILCQNGKIWMGSNEGLCWINSKDLIQDSVPPPIYIKTVLYGNDTSKLNSKSIFQYSDKSIRVFVEGLCFKDPQKLRFKYRLVGADEQWIITANREISFAGLSPGEYQLEIVAVNSDGEESVNPAIFSFEILAPFWRTWWFVSLLILTLIGIGWYSSNYILRSKQKRAKEKADTERRIAELRLSALRAQMNPHFIFNAINSIQHFVLQNDSEQAYNYLAKFSRLIRLVLDQSQLETIPLNQELQMLHLYIELEQLRFERPFSYAIHVDPNLEDENIRIPGMLVQPFVENAIWHGLLPKKTGDAKIIISFTKKERYTEIVIEDNGVGRANNVDENLKDGKRRSYGLQITEERLRLADTHYSDQPVIRITDLKDDIGNPSGTKVEIRLLGDDE